MNLHKYLNSKNTVSAIVAITAFLIILVFTRQSGVGISPDSTIYYMTAREFYSTGIVAYQHDPLVDFPAFYPIFLALIKFITQADPLTFAPYLNAILFGLVIFTCGKITDQFVYPSKSYKSLILLLLVFSPPLLQVYKMLWSETLFIFLLVLFFVSIRNYFLVHSLKPLLIAALIAGLACITRYAGITLIATGGLLLVLDRILVTRKKVKHLFVFAFVSAGILAINLIRNAITNGTLTGDRKPGITPLTNHINYFGSIIGHWLFDTGHTLAIPIGVFFIVAFSVAFFYNYIKKLDFLSFENIIITFFVVYAVFIIVSSTLSQFQRLDTRLLSPLYIPFVLGSTSWIPWQINSFKNLAERIAKGIITLVFLLFFIAELKDDYFSYKDIEKNGTSLYTSNIWKQSDIIRYLLNNKSKFNDTKNIYSNGTEELYFFTGIISDRLPSKLNKKEVQDFFEDDVDYDIWLNNVLDDQALTPDILLSNHQVISTYSFAEGKIFCLKKN